MLPFLSAGVQVEVLDFGIHLHPKKLCDPLQVAINAASAAHPNRPTYQVDFQPISFLILTRPFSVSIASRIEQYHSQPPGLSLENNAVGCRAGAGPKRILLELHPGLPNLGVFKTK